MAQLIEIIEQHPDEPLDELFKWTVDGENLEIEQREEEES